MSNHQPNEAISPQPRGNSLGMKIGAGALTLLAAVLCMGFSRWLYQPSLTPTAEKPSTAALKLPANLFAGWKKPDFVIVLSAQDHGYLLPCGCSHPQKGGFERRYNLIQLLRDKGWPVMSLGLGDIAQKESPVEQLANLQQIVKYRYAMMALKAMDYSAVGIGPIEADNLFPIYGEWALQGEKPITLSANLVKRVNYPGIEDWLETTPKGTNIKVGVTSIVGSSIADNRPKNDPVQFDFGGTHLQALRAKAKKTDFNVLLYEGYIDRGNDPKHKEAIACAKANPEYNVVLALDATDEAPDNPHVVKGQNTIIVTLGHKSKSVGVVGVYKTGNMAAPYELKYQRVEMGEDFLTPDTDAAKQPVLKLMEQYAEELKKQDYLAKYPQRKHPLQVAFPGAKKPDFAGSDACKGCHAAAFKIWAASGHSHAYDTLVNAKRPSNRQFDPECIVCHTVGFGYDSGFTDAKKTDFLKGVGCENCHGPSSEHIAAETAGANVQAWRKAINPWKYLPATVKKDRQMEDMCLKCHDSLNDVNWEGGKSFPIRWKLIEHYKQPKPKVDEKTPVTQQK